ncbi:spore coat associated protein CotJA [Lachnospiraceae bacterium 54-53]
MNSSTSGGSEKSKGSLATPTETVAVAIATVPMQPWEQPYDPQTALKHGTIFPCLNLPFYVTGGEQ